MKYLIPRFLEARLLIISWFRILKILHRNFQFVSWPLTCLIHQSYPTYPGYSTWKDTETISIGTWERKLSNFSFTLSPQFYWSDPLKNQGKLIHLCVAISGFHSTWLWSGPEDPSCRGSWHDLSGLSFSSISHRATMIAQGILITSSPSSLLLAGRIRSKIHV